MLGSNKSYIYWEGAFGAPAARVSLASQGGLEAKRTNYNTAQLSATTLSSTLARIWFGWFNCWPEELISRSREATLCSAEPLIKG